MNDPIKIVSLELENVKRVRAVRMAPAPTGLTVIGGDNRQGKTSVLDAICYALGGEKYRPTNLQREGGAADARIELALSNGLKVERKGKNASLKVTDPTGEKGGQRLLDAFVEELALNMPKFLAMPGREKARVLLGILGIGDQLEALDREEEAAYQERHAQGRIADQKEKYAAELPEHHDVPTEPLTAGELVRQSQEIMARNAERANARKQIESAMSALDASAERVNEQVKRIDWIKRQLADAEDELAKRREQNERAKAELDKASGRAITDDESTAEIEAKLSELEAVNAKVRQNLDKRKAIEDAEAARDAYNKLTAKVEDVRARRLALLDGADMPLPGLSVVERELVYNGKAWDCMSSAEQITAGVAIVRKLKPSCGFVLLDGLEKFDREQLAQLGAWLEAEGLQAIATRVSRGDECSIVIEDGLVVSVGEYPAENPAAVAGSNDLDY